VVRGNVRVMNDDGVGASFGDRERLHAHAIHLRLVFDAAVKNRNDSVAAARTRIDDGAHGARCSFAIERGQCELAASFARRSRVVRERRPRDRTHAMPIFLGDRACSPRVVIRSAERGHRSFGGANRSFEPDATEIAGVIVRDRDRRYTASSDCIHPGRLDAINEVTIIGIGDFTGCRFIIGDDTVGSCEERTQWCEGGCDLGRRREHRPMRQQIAADDHAQRG